MRARIKAMELMVSGRLGISFDFQMFMLVLILVRSRKEKTRLAETLGINIPIIIVGAVFVIRYLFVFV